MQVPLRALRLVKDNEQFLEIWRNGVKEVVKAPLLPYLYTKKDMQFEGSNREAVNKILLSTKKMEPIYRHEFPTILDVDRINETHDDKDLIENHIPFTDRVMIDIPKYYSAYPHTGELKVMFLDIETATEGGVSRDCIISAGYAIDDGDVSIVQGDEGIIIESVYDTYCREKPDIISGYNIMWDMNFLQRRARRNRVTKWEMTYPTIYYDIFDSVASDQTLYGVKNRGMKEVAKKMHIDAIVIDTSNTLKYSKQEIYDYNKSDVIVTRKLHNQYFPRYKSLADYLSLPLYSILDGSPSFIPSIVLGRKLHLIGVVSDGMAKERTEIGEYKGAVVELYRSGKFAPVWKIDFKGMYPSIQITTNCSPETTQIIGTEPLGEFAVFDLGESTVYSIPDVKENIRVAILKEPGVMPEELRKLSALRDDVKRRLKTTTDPTEKEGLYSWQWGIKIIQNCFYGYNANAAARFSDFGIAIVTTGVARECIKYVRDYIKQNYGDIVIELDTDGIYLSGDVNLEDIQSQVDEWASKVLGTRSELKIEKDSYKAGWFAKTKNYILLDNNDSLIIHGAGLMGSHKCRLWDSTLERVAMDFLVSGLVDGEVVERVLNPSNWKISDLVMRKTIHKFAGQYKNKHDLGVQLLEQGKLVGIKPFPGTQYEYLKTKGGYKIVQLLAGEGEIDRSYYRTMITKLLMAIGAIKGMESAVEKKKESLEDIVARRAIEDMLKEKVKNPCPQCKGEGGFLKRGTIVWETCPVCKGEKEVEVSV